MSEKIWKSVDGFPGYFVSNHGEIIGKKGTLLKPSLSYRGYHRANIYNADGLFQTLVHRVVAKAFIDNPENKKEVNHKDCNKLNNVASNLEWATSAENKKHAGENNRFNPRRGSRCTTSILKENDVRSIRYILKSSLPISQRELGNHFGCHYNTISGIKAARSWRHI